MAKKRIGIHTGTSGGPWTAVQRAVDYGAALLHDPSENDSAVCLSVSCNTQAKQQ